MVAVFGGNQRPLVFLVARLAAASLLRLPLLPLRLGVRMLRAGRQRGVLRRLAFDLPSQVPIRLQLRNLRQQRADDRLRFRRLASNQFFRDDRPCPLLSPKPAFMSRSVF